MDMKTRSSRPARAAWGFGAALLGFVAAGAFAACFVGSASDTTTGAEGGVDGSSPSPEASTKGDSTTAPPKSDGGGPSADSSADSSADGAGPSGGNWTYVLVDDMEMTTHGPIELDAGINPPVTPGYWYNSGAQVGVDAGDGGGAGDAGDMSDPVQGSFVFTALPKPTTTLNGKVSKYAARQLCSLTGLYDTCGVGFEFAQVPLLDGGADASARDASAGGAAGDAGDGGDAGPPIPRVTIPFDISQYKGIVFWGRTSTVDPTTGSLQVKVQFPDTDTDPRGEVCNGGGGNTSQCYNSYAAYFDFTTSWQEFLILLDAGDGGGAPDGGIAIDPSWGYQYAQWIPTKIYGINWQAQKNTDPDAGALATEIWVDDVFLIK